MSSQLSGLCAEFEQVMISSLVPHSLFASAAEIDAQAPADSNLTSDLFAQVFAEAFERAGGIGLGSELVRAIGKQP